MATSTIITIGLMILAFIGMIISAKIQKTNPNAKILAFVCLLVVLGCAIAFMKDSGVFGGETREEREMRASYERFRFSIAKKLGDTYAAAYKGKNVIVVAPNGEDFNKPEYANDLAFQNKVKEAFAGANVTIKGLPYKPSNNPSGIEDSMNPKYFEKFFNDNAKADLIVFTISLPPDPSTIQRFSVWGKAKAPKMIFIDAITSKFVGYLIQSGKIEAIVIQKPNLTVKDFEKAASNDLGKAFDERYILINKKNLVDFSKANKDLFAH